MISKKNLFDELDFYHELRTIVLTYTEIAAGRIQKIRTSVLRNRQFVGSLSAIYQELTRSYKDEVEKLARSTGVRANTIRQFVTQKNGRTALVFISSNTGLYGGIVKAVFDYFKEWVQRLSQQTDVAIIGQKGKFLYEEAGLPRKAVYFDFPDDVFDEEKFKTIVDYLVSYQDVLVFHGRFDTIGSQSPTMSDIVGNPAPIGKGNLETIRYKFEPSLGEILEFFETEIFTSLFIQSIYESRLAKYASRMTYLDKGSDQIKRTLKRLEKEKQAQKRRSSSLRQQEAVLAARIFV